MTDRPILFSAPMIRAILDGRKSQTRRIIKLPTKGVYEHPQMGGWEASTVGGGAAFTIERDGSRKPAPERPCVWHQTTGDVVVPRFAKGDRLWVKETWLPDPSRDDDAWDDWECSPVEFDGCGLKPSMVPPALRHPGNVIFAADPKWTIDGLRWKPSIHMPRWASRLTLAVTDVRVQRLQKITPADAIAEGIWAPANSMTIDCETRDPRDDFRALWNSINGPRSWEANPFVVAVSFSVTKANIDAARAA